MLMHKVAIPRNIAKGRKEALLENAPLTCQWCEVLEKVRFVYYSGIQTGSKEHRKTSNLFCCSARKGSPPQTMVTKILLNCLIMDRFSKTLVVWKAEKKMYQHLQSDFIYFVTKSPKFREFTTDLDAWLIHSIKNCSFHIFGIERQRTTPTAWGMWLKA